MDVLEALLVASAGTVLAVLVVLTIAGWSGRNAGDPHRLTGWVRSAGIALSSTSGPIAQRYVGLSGTLRVVGSISGWVIGFAFDRAFGLSTSTGNGFWIWLILGWIAGGVWAHRTITCELASAGPAPVASLTPRSARDYVPPAVRWGPVLAAALTVALAALGLTLGKPTDPNGFAVASTTTLLALALGAVVLAAAATSATRWVVDRSQAADDPDLLHVDDAMRASTAHLLGAGTTAAILLLALQTFTFVFGPRQLPFGMRGWIPMLLLVGALVFGRYLAYRPWRVRRAGRGDAVGAT